MKLYYAPGTCSLAPHIVAREIGLEIELEKVDLKSKRTETGADFSALNPKGYVPALAIDATTLLTEGPTVLQYLAEQVPQSPLLPAPASLLRYRLLEWLGFINSELHKVFTPLWHPESPAEAKATAREIIAKRFRFLDQHLSAHTFLLGDQFTLADAYCFTIVNWSNYLQIDLRPYPHLKRYQDQVAARPAVHQAMQAEGLLRAAQ